MPAADAVPMPGRHGSDIGETLEIERLIEMIVNVGSDAVNAGFVALGHGLLVLDNDMP